MSLDTTGMVVGGAVVAGAVGGAAVVVAGAVVGAVGAVVGCVVWVGASVEAVTTTVVVVMPSCDVTSRLHPNGTSASATIANARRVFIETPLLHLAL
jgi:uncharacterized membrane protein